MATTPIQIFGYDLGKIDLYKGVGADLGTGWQGEGFFVSYDVKTGDYYVGGNVEALGVQLQFSYSNGIGSIAVGFGVEKGAIGEFIGFDGFVGLQGSYNFYSNSNASFLDFSSRGSLDVVANGMVTINDPWVAMAYGGLFQGNAVYASATLLHIAGADQPSDLAGGVATGGNMSPSTSYNPWDDLPGLGYLKDELSNTPSGDQRTQQFLQELGVNSGQVPLSPEDAFTQQLVGASGGNNISPSTSYNPWDDLPGLGYLKDELSNKPGGDQQTQQFLQDLNINSGQVPLSPEDAFTQQLVGADNNGSFDLNNFINNNNNIAYQDPYPNIGGDLNPFAGNSGLSAGAAAGAAADEGVGVGSIGGANFATVDAGGLSQGTLQLMGGGKFTPDTSTLTAEQDSQIQQSVATSMMASVSPSAWDNVTFTDAQVVNTTSSLTGDSSYTAVNASATPISTDNGAPWSNEIQQAQDAAIANAPLIVTTDTMMSMPGSPANQAFDVNGYVNSNPVDFSNYTDPYASQTAAINSGAPFNSATSVSQDIPTTFTYANNTGGANIGDAIGELAGGILNGVEGIFGEIASAVGGILDSIFGNGGGSTYAGGGGGGGSTYAGGAGGGGGTYGGGGGNYGSGGGSYGGGSGYPVVLDLSGKGIKITPLSSSNMFFDMANDGYQHHTAWAGAGNGVLVYDPSGGAITQANQVNFTLWDPSAKTDMQALRDVFDSNHDGVLNASDSSWNSFRILVTNADGTTTLETLAQAGVTSINLTPNTYTQAFTDGSSIDGETTFTRSNGTTGTAATVTFAYDKASETVQQTVTHNGDGSTTLVNAAYNPDGTLAETITTNTSANGLSKTTTTANGSGIVLLTEADNTVVNGDGSTTETLTDKNGSGVTLELDRDHDERVHRHGAERQPSADCHDQPRSERRWLYGATGSRHDQRRRQHLGVPLEPHPQWLADKQDGFLAERQRSHQDRHK